jgi:hypothetical protein
MNDIVKSSVPDLAAQLLADTEFVSDLARYSEKLLTEKFIRRKYNLTDDAWERLGEDDGLIEAIEAEKIRRVRNGSAKREKAQQLITKGPDVLDKILSDESANPRHRVDAVKALDAIADPGPQATPAADKFIIHIDLTADAKLRSAEPDPNDIITIDATPRKTPAAITDKTEDDWKKW